MPLNADLSVAKLLLAAPARSILVCVKENLSSTPGPESTADYEREWAKLVERHRVGKLRVSMFDAFIDNGDFRCGCG